MKRALNFIAKMKEKNPGLDTLDIGGGAGYRLKKRSIFTPAKGLVSQIVKTAKTHCDKLGVKHPDLITEWGSYVAAPAQITIYKILAEKNVGNKGNVKWYVIDGSFMNDLIDTWAIHQKWHVTPVNHMNAKKLEPVWFAGSSCDSDDKYTSGGDNVMLPKFQDCDELFVAFFDTGAYQDALASHHCLLSSPAKLIAQNGEIKIARKRESSEEVGKMFGW